MSESCKMHALPIEVLKPKWVEFTDTKGVLRVLRPNEDSNRAKGMVFKCPRCRHNPQKDHYCIFLFPSAPEVARPQGRFAPALDPSDKMLEFSKQTLHEFDEGGGIRMLLKPRDLKCGWEGYFAGGKVSWRPSMIERLRSV